MIPVVTPEEMGAIDAAAPEPVEVLIDRAGAAVARAALDLLGGGYGRRVVVVAGKGNNGADGRAAAERLRRRGVRVTVLDAAALPAQLPAADLLVDAAYGTGFRAHPDVGDGADDRGGRRGRGAWEPPPVPDGMLVLAVDIPSGVDGLTGELHGTPWRADRTVTFAALKPGLLLGGGPERAGEVTVADIGLDVSTATAHVVTDGDVARWLPERPRDTHKWQSACWIVAGSPGMTGAAHLAAAGAQRAGAGYVRLSTPGLSDVPGAPVEVVVVPLAAEGWAEEVRAGAERFRALAVGPGLGTDPGTAEQVRALVGATGCPPVVVDGDGLTALADDVDGAVTRAGGATVLTPHDGELARLGADPGAPDRLAEVRALAARRGAVVLAKGSPTVVADPGGRVLIAIAGDSRLATAGTGDVLTGVIGALLAQGLPPLEAAGAAAHLHGLAGRVGAEARAAAAAPQARTVSFEVQRRRSSGGARPGPSEPLPLRRGLVASDVADHLPTALALLSED